MSDVASGPTGRLRISRTSMDAHEHERDSDVAGVDVDVIHRGLVRVIPQLVPVGLF
jgi:hypothetical protein